MPHGGITLAERFFGLLADRALCRGSHRLGPETRARVDELDAGARGAYETFLQRYRDAGEWPEGRSVQAGARYLSEQTGLAITQRASGEDASDVRGMLTSALSIFAPA